MQRITNTNFLRNHLYESRGIFSNKKEMAPTPEEILKTEWSNEFEELVTKGIFWWFILNPSKINFQRFKQFLTLMKNRLIMGFLRYGSVKDKSKVKYKRTNSIRQRLDLYEDIKTGGNLEHLIDIANIAQMEFIEQNHPNSHFHAQDDTIHQEVL